MCERSCLIIKYNEFLWRNEQNFCYKLERLMSLISLSGNQHNLVPVMVHCGSHQNLLQYTGVCRWRQHAHISSTNGINVCINSTACQTHDRSNSPTLEAHPFSPLGFVALVVYLFTSLPIICYTFTALGLVASCQHVAHPAAKQLYLSMDFCDHCEKDVAEVLKLQICVKGFDSCCFCWRRRVNQNRDPNRVVASIQQYSVSHL